jgi:hypothetical protein
VSYTYMPGSETIRFRMEVVDGGGRLLGQDLRAVLAPQPLAEATHPPISLTAPAERTADRGDTWRPKPHSAKPFQPPRRPETPPAGHAVLLEPPPLGATAQTTPPVSTSLTQELLADAPTPLGPSQPTAQAGEYIPPKPIREVQPVLPPNIRSIVPRRMRVQVRVSIDQYGKIVAAEPISAGPAPGNLLGTLAANAARLWLFEPARSNSRAVPSEVIVNFDFVPSPQR